MNVSAMVRTAAVFTVVTILPVVASAQGYRPPAGPTITPYLDYYRIPTSPLMDNYHDSVRTRREVQGNFNALGGAVRRQGARLDDLQAGLDQSSPSAAAPTGTGSTFLNYSHYYGGVRQQAYTPQRRAYRGNAGVGVGVGVGRSGGGARGAAVGVRTGSGGGLR